MTSIAKCCFALLAVAVVGGCTERLTMTDVLTLEQMSQSTGAGFKRFAVDPNTRIVRVVPLPGANLDDIVSVICTRVPTVRQVNFYSGDVDNIKEPVAAPFAASTCPQPLVAQ